ncbi:MAG: BON domain-containing protein [Nitrospirae bacterium]|nr:BON domain-containing protein [Nitrospirota bacterium]
MITSSRALIVLGMNLLVLAPIGADSAFSETQEKEGATEAKPQPAPAPKADTPTEHKEVVPEKHAPRPQHHPADTDSQPTPHKPSSEHKTPSQLVPPIKADGLPEPEAKERESAKEKEPVQEKEPAQEKESVKEKEPVKEKQPAKEKHPAKEKQPLKEKEPAKEKESVKEKEPAKEKESVKEKEPVKEKETPKKALGSLILSVKLALMGDSRLFHYEIEAEDNQQTLTLTGRVSTEDDKTAATEVAQAVQGVKTVVNKLTVEKDLAKTLLKKQDEILTTIVKERFAKSATLKAANFEVKTEDGVVLLNGTVRFQVIALEAAETARQVPGVRAVNTEKIRLEGES